MLTQACSRPEAAGAMRMETVFYGRISKAEEDRDRLQRGTNCDGRERIRGTVKRKE